MSISEFYDDLAEFYDLIYADWNKSMSRQSQAIDQMLGAQFGERVATGLRILDVSAGIGTQSLPLAEMGHRVTARDLSPASIARLSREAAGRGLSIDAAPSDMRSVSVTVHGPFDAIIAFDNAIAHLQTDDEIIGALRGFRNLLVPGGVILFSVRDYERVDRTPNSTHSYGERTRGDRTFRVEQEWEWLDPDHYRTTFLIEELKGDDWLPVTTTSSVYYAIPIARLIEFMGEAGFCDCEQSDVAFFQPVLTGKVAE